MDTITYALSKKYTDSKVSQSTGLHREIVNSLPATGDNNTIYMVLDPNASSPDIYDEWLWVNGAYEHIGSTRVDLTDYYNKTQVDAALNGKANVATTLSGYGIIDAYTKTEVNNALSNKQGSLSFSTKWDFKEIASLGSNQFTSAIFDCPVKQDGHKIFDIVAVYATDGNNVPLEICGYEISTKSVQVDVRNNTSATRTNITVSLKTRWAIY